MFKEKITSTAFTTREAQGFFTNIQGESYSRDISFVSTLRALVYPRMPEGDVIHVRHDSKAYSKSTIESYTPKSFVEAAFPDYYNDGEVCIYGLNSTEKENNIAALGAIEKGYLQVHHGWEKLQQITVMYQKQFKVLCYINPEHKKVSLFVESYDIRKHHYLQVAILAMMPWYFDPDKGVTEVEMELMKSLQEKTPDNYVATLAKIAEQYDFRTMKIKTLLSGFELQYERREIESVKNNIQHCNNQINSFNESISNYLKDIRTYEIKLMGLEEKLANGGDDSEIMEYFLCNKNLELQDVSNESMTFVIKAYAEFFDEDMASTVIEKENSYVYRNNDRRIATEDMKRLMTALFLDQTLKLRFCAAYRFNLTGNVRGINSYDYGADFQTYMPNPHIDYHSCLGSYSNPINELLRQNNYIGAIEQCAASCRSLNFRDSVVMGDFMSNLYGTGRRGARKCIELPDGSVVSTSGAIEWLKAQEVTNE